MMIAGGLTADEPFEPAEFSLCRKIELLAVLWTIWLPLVRMSSMLWLRNRPVLRPSEPWLSLSTWSESFVERRLVFGWYIEIGPMES